MRTPTAARACALLLLGAATLSGCGEKDPGRPAADVPATQQTAPAPPTSTPPAPTPSRTATTKPRPTKKPTRTAGSGGGGGTEEPATEGGGVCADLDARDVGAALAVPVTGSALPGGGCGFDPSKDADPSATIVETSFKATPGGMAGAKTNATSSVEGDPVDLDGIGDAAFVVTGTAFGEPAIQGAGAVRVGDRLVNVTVSQGGKMSRSKVRGLVVALLRVVAERLG